MPQHSHKGIFCLEGDWESDLRSSTSMQPVLDLLSRSHDPIVRFIRRDIGTAGELEYYLGKWVQKRYVDYPILYLGFHGDPGVLYMGSRKFSIDLDWLEERLLGRCKGRIIHFGSCGTMAVHGLRLKRFLKRTRALAVCGYKADVDWMLTAAFEIILLSRFQFQALTRGGLKAVRRRIRGEAFELASELEFKMVIAP
jgi:hypothetical protein